MSLEADASAFQLWLLVLQFLGATSVVGLLGLYSAWLAFPPELVIEAVVDKSKGFNSESKIIIKNSGRLPALAIKADAENLCARIGGIQMTNCEIHGSSDLIGRLAYGETAEISVRAGIGMNHGMHISEFSYTLTLRYQAKLFVLRKSLSKRWKVQLRNFQDGYSWDVAII